MSQAPTTGPSVDDASNGDSLIDWREREYLLDRLQRLDRQSSVSPGRAVCFRCAHAHIMRRAASNDPTIFCRLLARFVAHDVMECNQLQEVGKLNIGQLLVLGRFIDTRDGTKDGYR